MGSADATPTPAVNANVRPPTAAASLVNDSLTMCGHLPELLHRQQDGDDNFSAIVVCDRGYQACWISSHRNTYRGPGRKRNCAQVSAGVALVTQAETDDGAAADSAPGIPRAWQVVDVYVQRLVSVTRRIRLPGTESRRGRADEAKQPTD
jgi:hypothetical protein